MKFINPNKSLYPAGEDQSSGISLREHIAVEVLKQLLVCDPEDDPRKIAKKAIAIADTFLAVLDEDRLEAHNKSEREKAIERRQQEKTPPGPLQEDFPY